MSTSLQHLDLVQDPAALGWPPGLPLELALRQQPVRDICRAYGIPQPRYDALRLDPNFRAAVLAAVELLREEGSTFRLKARAQAEELLKTSWNLVHGPLDEVPASVKADLIKFTIRAAGLDASVEQRAKAAAEAQGAAVTALQINLHLGD